MADHEPLEKIIEQEKERNERWDGIWKQHLDEGGLPSFDKSDSAQPLKDIIAQNGPSGDGTLPTGRALVPGCGSGYDVAHLATACGSALGIDFSDFALERANELIKKEKLQDKAEVKKIDFFKLDEGKFDVIYDYTFLCALEPKWRKAWAEKMASLLAKGGELITMIYPIVEKEGGPPFAVTPQLYKDLLEPHGFKASIMEPVPDEKSFEVRRGKEYIARWKLEK